MKRYVKDIIKSIRYNHENWKVYNAPVMHGITDGNVEVYGIGNTRFCSIAYIKINDIEMDINFVDRFCVEVAVLRWFKNCPLGKIKNDTNIIKEVAK